MNEQITNKAGAILDLLLQWMNGAASLASKELPLLFEEYITYHIINELPIVSASLFLLSLALLIFTIVMLTRKKCWDDGFGLALMLVCIMGGAAIKMGDQIIKVVQIKHAPKAYLIEQFRNGNK